MRRDAGRTNLRHRIEWALLAVLLLAACGKDKGTKPPPGDTTPPAAITDLSVVGPSSKTVVLAWTSPVSEGSRGYASRYEVRRAAALLTESDWAAAVVVEPPPSPKPAGQQERLTINGLPNGTWYFAVKAADDVPNWSAISNPVHATVSDPEAPAPVADLTVSAAGATRLTLTWTAPGNDGTSGRAAEYDLRRSFDPITAEGWSAAERIEGVPAPDSAGTEQAFVVTGLERQRTYYFALQTRDAGPNWSGLSNQASGSTTPPRRLTNGPSAGIGAVMPAWSPDGTTIAFAADWSTPFRDNLYTVPAEGGEPVAMTSYPLGAFGPTWSPDGARIAFVAQLDLSETGICIIDAEPMATPLELFRRSWAINGPAWSPDGTRIAFSADSGATAFAIFTTPSPGGLLEVLLGDEYRNTSPTWSPDGARIAFVSNRAGGADVWSMPVAGGDLARLTATEEFEADPAWSPDGNWIAFTSTRNGNRDVWMMPAAGGPPVQLTFDPATSSSPSWSPDGTRIAYSSRGDGSGDIWILAVE